MYRKTILSNCLLLKTTRPPPTDEKMGNKAISKTYLYRSLKIINQVYPHIRA